MSVMESRVAEVALQRSQLEELTQSLSRSRDESLVADVDASIRLAQQQAELTGSLQPLTVALKNAHQRIERAAQPRLAPVLRAMEQDSERLERASVTDTAGLLGRLDDLARQIDELPLANAVAHPSDMRPPSSAARTASADTPASEPAWQAALRAVWHGVRCATRRSAWCASVASTGQTPCSWRPIRPTSCARTRSCNWPMPA